MTHTHTHTHTTHTTHDTHDTRTRTRTQVIYHFTNGQVLLLGVKGGSVWSHR